MRFRVILIALILTFLLSIPGFATNAKLNEKQSASITSICNTIRQDLKNLQRTDARARTYFGSIYETISSKYLKPLNIRIVNNDSSNPTLLKLQSDLAEARTTFSEDYIKYSKSLEELVNIDCRVDPTGFYDLYVSTREKRAIVSSDIKALNNILNSVVKSTEKLKESLK